MQVDAQSNWYVENLRVTLFMTPSAPHPLYAEIVGVLPTEVVARPQLQSQQETGITLGGNLSVIQQAGRVDVILNSTPPAAPQIIGASEVNAFSHVGRLEDSVPQIEKIAKNLAPLTKNATRAAFAVTLFQQTDLLISAMQILKTLLPTVQFDPQNDTDFSYQINHPTKNTRGHRINRLARWEAMELRIIHFIPQALLPTPVAPLPRPIFAARVYIDVSTDAENTTPLNDRELLESLHEVRVNALEIAAKGDAR